jgi:hypothetical protein
VLSSEIFLLLLIYHQCPTEYSHHLLDALLEFIFLSVVAEAGRRWSLQSDSMDDLERIAVEDAVNCSLISSRLAVAIWVDAVCAFLLPLKAAIRFFLSCFTLPIYLSVYYLTSFTAMAPVLNNRTNSDSSTHQSYKDNPPSSVLSAIALQPLIFQLAQFDL